MGGCTPHTGPRAAAAAVPLHPDYPRARNTRGKGLAKPQIEGDPGRNRDSVTPQTAREKLQQGKFSPKPPG